MKKFKLFTAFSMLLLGFNSMDVHAETETVCTYVENCEGELELVCVGSNAPAPCQLICPPGCENPED